MSTTDGQRTPTAGLVLIGNELLSGKVQDSNGPYLITSLRRQGIDLAEIHVVADEIPAIVEAVNLVRARRDHCFTSGGIGPTHDDVTMEGIAAAFGAPLEERDDLVEMIARFFGTGESGQAWRKMASVPVGTMLLHIGTGWPVYTVENVYVLPGIPEVFRRQADHLLESIGGTPVVTNIAYFLIGEGELTAPLTELAEFYAGTVAFGSYPVWGVPEYKVKVTVDSRDEAALAEATAALLARFPESALYELAERVPVADS